MVRCPREWRREALRFLKVGGVVSRADLSRRLVRCCWLRFPPNGSFCCLLSSSHLFARRYTSHVTHRIGQRTRRNKLRFREEVATSVGYVVAAATTTANAFETCSRAHVRSASAWGQAFFFFLLNLISFSAVGQVIAIQSQSRRFAANRRPPFLGLCNYYVFFFLLPFFLFVFLLLEASRSA